MHERVQRGEPGSTRGDVSRARVCSLPLAHLCTCTPSIPQKRLSGPRDGHHYHHHRPPDHPPARSLVRSRATVTHSFFFLPRGKTPLNIYATVRSPRMLYFSGRSGYKRPRPPPTETLEIAVKLRGLHQKDENVVMT